MCYATVNQRSGFQCKISDIRFLKNTTLGVLSNY